MSPLSEGKVLRFHLQVVQSSSPRLVKPTPKVGGCCVSVECSSNAYHIAAGYSGYLTNRTINGLIGSLPTSLDSSEALTRPKQKPNNKTEVRSSLSTASTDSATPFRTSASKVSSSIQFSRQSMTWFISPRMLSSLCRMAIR